MLTISFRDQFVLVTGGTRGIGAAIAQEILACEGHVIVTGTHAEPPTWMLEARNKRPHQVVAYEQLNIATAGWLEQLDTIAHKYSAIPVVINNAGIASVADIRELHLEDLQRVLEVNLVAPAMVVSRLAPGMTARGYGRIVNISSIMGVLSLAGRSSYSASKSGIIGQTRACALDLAKDGILVNAVCPGFIATDMPRKTLGEAGLAQLGQRVPLGRVGECADIVSPTLFLASNLNTYITGQTLVVDGGYSIE